MEVLHFLAPHHRVDVSGHHNQGYMISGCHIIGNVNLDQLVKVVSARFPDNEVTIFLCVIHEYLGGNILKLLLPF